MSAFQSITLSGDLPSGGDTFSAWVAADQIALRVGQRICAAHPRWMTPVEARELAEALLVVAASSPTEPPTPEDGERP